MGAEGDDANAACVRNDEAFKAAPLSGANASWHRERWGDTMTDHGEGPAGDGDRGSTRKNAIFLKCLWTNSEYPNSLKSMSI
jgi:hypothetical protein